MDTSGAAGGDANRTNSGQEQRGDQDAAQLVHVPVAQSASPALPSTRVQDGTTSCAATDVRDSQDGAGSLQEQREDAQRAQILQLGQALSAQALQSAARPPPRDQAGAAGAAEHSHAFWGTQPVAQFTDDLAAMAEDGPIDAPKTAADVRQEPYNLPPGFVWSVCDMTDAAVVEQVHALLARNYVEDDDEMFRFKYSQAFLQWALQVPGFVPDWHLGVRIGASGRLMGFISAIPARVRVNAAVVDMVEINFLCVHKKLRSKRLAPVLIKEITRRVNLRGVWQAAYTAGVVLPKPVATCQYWHRSLNPKKLIDIGFSRLQARMTMARTLKLYKLTEETATPGIRPMTRADVPQVKTLLDSYLARFSLAPVMGEADLAHALLPTADVVSSYVVEAPDGQLTDLTSFYTLPSSVIGHDRHDEIRAAFHYYTVPGKTPLQQLMADALIVAKRSGHDVFNALDLMQNMDVFKELKFGIGDGKLNYYLYNWRVRQEMPPSAVGLVLL